jgi:CheY-like chemotaxis protein
MVDGVKLPRVIDGVNSHGYNARMAKTREKGGGGELRQLFLDAAREILREPETSLDLRKVAERAGKSRTAPYLAFGPTEEGGGLPALRLAVAADGFRELAWRMERALEGSPDPEAGLKKIAAAYLAFARDEPRLFRLMFGEEVGRAQAEASPSGPGRQERDALQEARAGTEDVFLQAIQMEDGGYLRGHSAFAPWELAGAVWSLLHGVAMLTIDEQWATTRLGMLDDPGALAVRTLRFLTAASREEIAPAEAALLEAARRREVEPKGRRDLSPSAYMSRPYPSADASPSAEFDTEPYGVRDARRAPPPSVAEGRVSSAIRRARDLTHLTRHARILWIDDRPELSTHEETVFRALGAVVSRARSTRQAVQELRAGSFDVIVSDIARGQDPDQGVRDLPLLRKLAPGVPVIFYIGQVDPMKELPGGAFGLTSDPEELLHLVFDALERQRR